MVVPTDYTKATIGLLSIWTTNKGSLEHRVIIERDIVIDLALGKQKYYGAYRVWIHFKVPLTAHVRHIMSYSNTKIIKVMSLSGVLEK